MFSVLFREKLPAYRETVRARLKSVPFFGWVCGVLCFALEGVLYTLSDFLVIWFGTDRFFWCPKIPLIDDAIPLIPAFALIYVWAYVFWICAPAVVSLTGKKHFLNYLIGLLAAYLVGFLVFVFAPTYLDRAGDGLLAATAQPGFSRFLLSFIYRNDGGAIGTKCFPSYHCLISWYAYLGVRKQESISKGYRVYSLIVAILICLSTQFTKQHYFMDMPGGILVATVCYFAVQRLDPASKILQKQPEPRWLSR